MKKLFLNIFYSVSAIALISFMIASPGNPTPVAQATYNPCGSAAQIIPCVTPTLIPCLTNSGAVVPGCQTPTPTVNPCGNAAGGYGSNCITPSPTLVPCLTNRGTIVPGCQTPTPTVNPCGNAAGGYGSNCITPSPTPTDNNNCEDGQEYDSDNHICIDCDGGGTCEVNTGGGTTPTPTPIVSSTPTPTNSPTSQGDNNSNNSTSAVGGASASSSPSQNVLGTTTMASTGNFTAFLSNALMGLGLTFTTLAGASYAKKKK